jgi:hypothetical protein
MGWDQQLSCAAPNGSRSWKVWTEWHFRWRTKPRTVSTVSDLFLESVEKARKYRQITFGMIAVTDRRRARLLARAGYIAMDGARSARGAAPAAAIIVTRAAGEPKKTACDRSTHLSRSFADVNSLLPCAFVAADCVRADMAAAAAFAGAAGAAALGAVAALSCVPTPCTERSWPSWWLFTL